MKIEKVTATIRFSKPCKEGWKTVELGAEASVNRHEGWRKAQARLYGDLGEQLKAVWANGGKP